MNEKLLAICRFYFAQSVFSSTIHFKAYGGLTKKANQMSIVAKSVSAITLILLILQIIGLEQRCQPLLNILAHIGLLLTAASFIIEMFNKEERTQEIFKHKLHAEKYKSLRDEYMSLIEKIMSNSVSDDQLRILNDELKKRYSAIGEHAPDTNGYYQQAQKGLGLTGNGEEFTWSDKEIDKFLPEQLRLLKE